MRPRRVFLVVALLMISLKSFGQGSNYSASLEKQLRCRTNPEAGKLLLSFRDAGYIKRTYVIQDTISYFRLLKPVRILGFNPVAVFGFQQGFEKFFVRAPGISPPEMIGIVVRGNQDAVKLRLRKLGIDNLEVEPHIYDLSGEVKTRGSGLVAIACWATE